MEPAPRLRIRHTAEASEAYELVLSVAAACAHGRAQPEAWVAEAAELAGEELLEEARTLCGGCDMVWAHVLSVAYETPAPRDADGLLRRLADTPAAELRLRLLGFYVRWFRRATPPAVTAAAARGDATSRRTLLATSYPDDSDWQAGMRGVLAMGAVEGKRRFTAVLRRWRQRVFDPLLREAWMPELEREARLRRAAIRRDGPEAALADVAGRWEYVPEPGISHVVMIPSLAIRPVLHVLDHHQVKLVCYPVAPRSTPAMATPPPALVATARALGDSRRLQVLRLLAAQERAPTELAALLGVGLTTLAHHLDVLREAELVVVRDGRPRRYALVDGVEAELGRSLEGFLRG